MNPARIAAALLAATVVASPALAASSNRWTWFSCPDDAFAAHAAAPWAAGVHSEWGRTDAGQSTWDFRIGAHTPDVSWTAPRDGAVWSLAGTWNCSARFQFNSPSFDMWAVDILGGLALCRRSERLGIELLAFHTSSHLGDEILERGDRERIDASSNGARLMLDRRLSGGPHLFAGASWTPLAEPADRESLALHLGIDWSSLPPFQRGYLAAHADLWEYRSWQPDLRIQAGLLLGSRQNKPDSRLTRLYLLFRSGAVPYGQYWDETESVFGVGISHPLP